jgi:hypothetical protein
LYLGAFNGPINFASGASARNINMTLAASGNLGIGTTPSGYLANKVVISTGTDSNNGITIASATNRNGSIWFADGTTGDQAYRGGVDYQHTTDTLYLYSGGQGNIQLNASGNLGLGVTPSAWFSASRVYQFGSGGALEGRTNESQYLALTANQYIDSAGAFKYIGSTFASRYQQYNGIHSWSTAPSGTAGNAITFTQVLAVEGAKSLALEGATPQSGTGITFPATQSASSNANTLDDYEEGTWTPGYEGLAGSIGSLAYSTQAGRYTRIGRTVFATAEIVLTDKGSWTSGARFTGLPFTNSGATEIAFGSVILGFVDFAAGQLYAVPTSVRVNSTTFYIDIISDNADRAILGTAAVANNSSFSVNLVYTAA